MATKKAASTEAQKSEATGVPPVAKVQPSALQIKIAHIAAELLRVSSGAVLCKGEMIQVRKGQSVHQKEQFFGFVGSEPENYLFTNYNTSILRSGEFTALNTMVKLILWWVRLRVATGSEMDAATLGSMLERTFWGRTVMNLDEIGEKFRLDGDEQIQKYFARTGSTASDLPELATLLGNSKPGTPAASKDSLPF